MIAIPILPILGYKFRYDLARISKFTIDIRIYKYIMYGINDFQNRKLIFLL